MPRVEAEISSTYYWYHKMRYNCFFTITCIVLLSIVSAPLYAGWETSNPFVGVTYSKLRDSDVHPILGWSSSLLSVDVMEIDLDAEGIGFHCTPSNGAGFGETDRQTTMNFMQSSGTEIAINTNFYSYSTNDCLGLVYSDSNLVSSFSSAWPSINISPDNQAELITAAASVHDYPYGNAFSGSVVIVKNGDVVSNSDTAYHPRTAAGYNAEENKLILMTVDGRQTQSIGVKLEQLGTLMANFGATWAVNLDGGGSTQMTSNTGTAAYVNSPSETYRAVAANLGVHAIVDTSFHEFANFEHGNKATFEYSPGYSGSSQGFNESSSNTVLVDTAAGAGQGSLQVNIIDDSSQTEQWFARIISGSSAAQSQNTIREAAGYVGLMAKTTDADTFISFALDDPITGDRGLQKELIADGQWHWYQWDIEDNSQWESWTSSGNGQIDGSIFTIDSVQLWGTDNATVHLDQISHCSTGPLSLPPVAEDDFYSIDEDKSLYTYTWRGVLANDVDPDGGTLWAIKVSDPAHGAINLNSDGLLAYLPEENWGGTDTFTYKVTDGTSYSDIATVTLTVDAVNDAPLVVADAYDVQMGDFLVVQPEEGLLTNDSDIEDDELSAVLVNDALPSHGEVQFLDEGGFTYLPDAGFVGTDSFEYKVFDGTDYSEIVVCTLTIAANAIPGDANNDGVVDDADAAILAGYWQQTAYWSWGDFNGDRIADEADATILAANWMKTTSAGDSVPEPGTLFLLIAGMMMTLLGRKAFHRRWI